MADQCSVSSRCTCMGYCVCKFLFKYLHCVGRIFTSTSDRTSARRLPLHLSPPFSTVCRQPKQKGAQSLLRLNKLCLIPLNLNVHKLFYYSKAILDKTIILSFNFFENPTSTLPTHYGRRTATGLLNKRGHLRIIFSTR
jgi:hypothetical protein